MSGKIIFFVTVDGPLSGEIFSPFRLCIIFYRIELAVQGKLDSTEKSINDLLSSKIDFPLSHMDLFAKSQNWYPKLLTSVL